MHSQVRIITGQVLDSFQSPVVGASIIEESDRTNGTVSDFDGNFSIRLNNNSNLTISYLGFKDKIISTIGLDNITVILEEDFENLDEITVVAYVKQKKSSVIAAVTSISPKELRVPTSNLTTSIAGRIAGVIAYQRSGEPGRDNSEFFIRGVSTFGYARSPLILIDGIETTSRDLARLQPDDISSFSIMKDATATALYGARGANGVILVTTKEGIEGEVNINVRYESSYSEPTKTLRKPCGNRPSTGEPKQTLPPLHGRTCKKH